MVTESRIQCIETGIVVNALSMMPEAFEVYREDLSWFRYIHNNKRHYTDIVSIFCGVVNTHYTLELKSIYELKWNTF